MASFNVCHLLMSLWCFVGFHLTQQQALNQYQQYQMNMINRMNGRGVQTVAFMMNRGHPHTNANFSGQYITFVNTPVASNARVFSEFAAFQATLPGLYYFSYRFLGANASATTEVQLIVRQQTTGTNSVYASAVAQGTQVTADGLAMLALNDTVFLQTAMGSISDDSASNNTFNSFMGVLLMAEQANPFLQSLFNNNVVVNANNNNANGNNIG